MAKVILHTQAELSTIAERRLHEDFSLSKNERLFKAFRLMKLALMFKGNKYNVREHKGIVLKHK